MLSFPPAPLHRNPAEGLRLPLLRAACLCLLLVALAASAAERPHILVIMADDQGWGDLSLHGNQQLSTPNLDRLAREGARFEHFFVQPVCSPTRAEFLTGRYHTRSGVYSTSAGGERLALGERTIAEVFREAGYRTGIFGKWHSGSQYPYHPLGRGFDEFYGFASGHWGLYFDPMIEHNGALTRAQGYLPDDFTDRAADFIEHCVASGQPSFSFLALNTPHSPMQVPDAYWEPFKDKDLTQRGTDSGQEDLDHTRAALAMVENIDVNVGRLLARLDQLGIRDETVVVYLTDNGPNGDRWNGGMRGRKGSTDEGGVRSPLFVRWPGHIEAGRTVSPIAGVIDLLPTLADLAGVAIQPLHPLDGRSLAPLLRGGDQAGEDRTLFSHWRDRTSARTQRFRLDHQGRLYDMISDPGQSRDVSAQHPQAAAQLAQLVESFREHTIAGDYGTQRPFPVGHPDFSVTYLPARDAQSEGTIKRSNRYPNDSYFTHWTSSADALSWEVEILSPGLYAADILYACPARDLGATIRLEYGEAFVEGRVLEPHDPSILGLNRTRADLQESPVKIFRRMGLGTIRLPADDQSSRAQHVLRLRAVDIPGSQALEFRMLILTRVGR